MPFISRKLCNYTSYTNKFKFWYVDILHTSWKSNLAYITVLLMCVALHDSIDSFFLNAVKFPFLHAKEFPFLSFLWCFVFVLALLMFITLAIVVGQLLDCMGCILGEHDLWGIFHPIECYVMYMLCFSLLLAEDSNFA